MKSIVDVLDPALMSVMLPAPDKEREDHHSPIGSQEQDTLVVF